MKHIIAFAGSSSSKSINKQLATYASTLVENTEALVLDLNDFELPIYSSDYETAKGIPDNATRFLELLKKTDGIIISLAEHNGSYATVFKNLFDWLSRAEPKNWLGKPMLLLSSSPGERGGQTVMDMAMERFPRHDANIVGQFSLPFFYDNFSDGKITNTDLNHQLLEEVHQFKASL